MIATRLTAKSQTTVPRAVRAALGLRPGDTLTYEIDGDRVILRRRPTPASDGFIGNLVSFAEWSSEEDAGYDGLGGR